MLKVQTVEFRVRSELYGKTTCVVNVERFKSGIRTFPCGDGSDHKLNDRQVREVNRQIKEW